MSSDETASRRIRREKKTIGAMVGMYCRARHGTRGKECDACQNLLSYAELKIDRCAFRDSKPACNECRVHCYSRESREQIRAVMRFAGPRMMFHHPVLGVLHIVDRLGHRRQ